MKYRKSISVCIAAILLLSGCRAEVSVPTQTSQISEISQTEEISKTPKTESPKISYDQSKRFSDEYRSCKYYQKLMSALEKNKNSSFMQRVLDVALSQNGYLAYALEDVSVEQARNDGKLWTGAELHYGSTLTGNTEYTRWFYQYVLESDSPYIDCEWCSIFVSWCMYQSGYHSDLKSDREYYYSYCADPRKEQKDHMIQSFNLDQNKVWYTPTASAKVRDFQKISPPVHTEVNPYDIDYKPGGLIFISWDGSGWSFEHIGIVIEYDKTEHTLTYIGGNDYGSVMINTMDFDTDTFDVQPVVKNSQRLMAYAEYDAETPLPSWFRDEFDNPLKSFTDKNGNQIFYYNEKYYNS